MAWYLNKRTKVKWDIGDDVTLRLVRSDPDTFEPCDPPQTAQVEDPGGRTAETVLPAGGGGSDSPAAPPPGPHVGGPVGPAVTYGDRDDGTPEIFIPAGGDTDASPRGDGGADRGGPRPNRRPRRRG